MSKRKLVVWRLGFDSRANFFHLHCPADDRSRVALCQSAIALLLKAWPHLRATESKEDEATFLSSIQEGDNNAR